MNLISVWLGAACGALAAAGPAAAAGEPWTLRSGPEQTPLVELYTSEGCSSCPPAEAWLSTLAKAPGLWTEFVPVAFHVDYWDDLGWRDALASPNATARQRAYAAAWSSESIYTPEFVLGGKEWRGWARGAAPKGAGRPGGRLEVRSDRATSLIVDFIPPAGAQLPAEVHAAWLAVGVTRDIRRGENAGRKLTHDFTVVGWSKADLKTEPKGDTAGVWKATVSMPRPDALGGRLALAAWVSPKDQPAPWQSVGGWAP